MNDTAFMKRSDIEAIADHALSRALRLGASGADLAYSASCGSSLSLLDGEIEECSSGVSARIGVRTIISDGRQGIASGGRLDAASVDALVEWSLHNALASEPEEGVMLYDGPFVSDPELDVEDLAIRGIKHEDRMRYCLEMTETARGKDSRVRSVREAGYGNGWGESFFANTNGLSGWESCSSASCSVLVLAEEGEFSEMGGYGKGALRMDEIDTVKIAERAVKDTVSALGGAPVATGAYTVMIEPMAAAALVGVIGGLFCATDVQKGRSMLRGKLGQNVASSCVSITDDGRIPWKPGTASMDFEGVPTQRTELIKNGIAAAFLYDLQSAAKDGVKTTGNCSRGTGSLPDVGTHNLILDPGRESPEDLQSCIADGIYITEFMGLHTIDSVSGDFSLGAKGLRIEKGVLTVPVSGITIASNLLDLMKKITALGSDLTFSGSVAAPTVVIENVVIAGK